MKRIYVGYDSRQLTAYRACVESLRLHSRDIEIHPVSSRLLGTLYRRPEMRREGVLWDEISRAPMATEFSIARFFVPYLAKTGWALYCDSDFLWRADVGELFALADERFAVQCVKHEHAALDGLQKMDGQVQTSYARKNWSSLILWNCAHEANRIVNPSAHTGWVPHERLQVGRDYLNGVLGLSLHQFAWIEDEELIGALPPEWNWLAGVSDPAIAPKAVHYTLGTPDLPGYESAPFADEWRACTTSRE